jgi:Uma2 family endonuclease
LEKEAPAFPLGVGLHSKNIGVKFLYRIKVRCVKAGLENGFKFHGKWLTCIRFSKTKIARMEVIEKLLTYQEYRALEFDEDDNFQYELLNGMLMRKSSPTIQHQRIVGNIYFQFRLFAQQKKIGEAFIAPLDVVLNETNAPQPDVIFVGKENTAILNEEEQVIIGIPDILVEVISPGSVKNDRFDKKEIYEKTGVPEYWVIDPSNRSIEVLQLVEGRYELFDFAEGEGKIKSSVLKELELDLQNLL